MAQVTEGRIVQWENYVTATENILSSPQVPSSLQIITLIKKVNPTKLTLSETDRERGYQLKNRLQSLLLEHYGDTFHLVPHPASPNIILIKHRVLPSIDACHADLASLSSEALAKVETAAPLYPGREEVKGNRGKGPRETGHGKTGVALSPKKTLKKAQFLLEKYDYAAAEELLAGLHAASNDDRQVLLRGAAILLHDIGAYQRCIDTLLSQPKSVLKDRGIREMLAVAYHHNGSLAEARAILDELYPSELGLESLFAYADIAFKDANLCTALELVGIAKGKEGFFSGLDSLQKEIEAAMSALAGPVAQKAQAALQSAAIEEAGQLAREALELYPNCQQARAVLSAVEAVNAEAQLAGLWARLENEPSGERRIPLLARLLERDKEKRDTIRKLLSEEKERRRSRLFDERLESLRGLVRQECWADCFDGVTFLMRQPEFGQRANEVLSLCPFFPVLHDNKLLQGAADRSVKDLWLRFVKAKIAFAAGNAPDNTAACFEVFEELKPWFNSFPEFQDDYLLAQQREQEKARVEIGALLAQSEVPECPVGEVRRIYGCLRKRMPVLPSEERRDLVRTMEERLARLIPEHDPGHLLEEYREALQIGHSEKAAYLRQEIIDSAAREAVDAEFAAAFHIDWEPLTFEISDDLPIDLTTVPPLLIYYPVGHRILLRDGRDSYVMIDFAAKAACRMTSPIFAKTSALDATQEGIFLFVEENGEKIYGDRLWRAELSVERAAFTAHFDMRQRFEVEDGFNVEAVQLSSERDTDYFVLIKHIEGRCPAKLMKKRLAPNATIQTLQLGNRSEFRVWRWGSCPDNFIVGGEGEMKRVNRNLSVKAGVSVTPNLYKLDGPNGCIYGVEEARMTKRGTRLEFIKSFESAPCFGMYEPGRVHGISFQTDTALMVMGEGRQTFYNLRNNTFSNKIRVGRVIPYYQDGKWYCFDYNKEAGKLWLRDITQEIHTILTWRQFFFLRKNRKNMIKLMLWFNECNNFMYRPEEWGPCELGESDPEGEVGNLRGEPAE
jgi:thioredoxin-related protein